MNFQWLQHTNNERLILLFLGWGMDVNCVSQVRLPQETDVVAIWNYIDTQGLQSIDLKAYSRIDVIAWSMGVFAAAEIIAEYGRNFFCSVVAINGTAKPIDQREGIDPKIVRLTRDNWCPSSRDKFNARLLGGAKQLNLNANLMSQRDIEEQRNELSAIINRAPNQLNFSNIIWNKAIIGSRDLIFLPENQCNYWCDNAREIIEVDMPHFPFLMIDDLSCL